MNKVMSEAQEQIEARLAQLEPGSDRYELLRSARDFKAAWVNLGEKLTMVLEQKLYEQWNYSTYEEYCEEELRIRKGTAYKLTRSYSFLRDNEPQILDSNQPVTNVIPQYEVADLLRQAHESENIDADTYADLREQACQPEMTKAAFMRQVREADPVTFQPPKPKPNQDLKKALSLVRRLKATAETIDGLWDDIGEAIATIETNLEDRITIKTAQQEE